MDINFHYFAVKTIAIKAGFDEEKAQRIASKDKYTMKYNKSNTEVFCDDAQAIFTKVQKMISFITI